MPGSLKAIHTRVSQIQNMLGRVSIRPCERRRQTAVHAAWRPNAITIRRPQTSREPAEASARKVSSSFE
jgi:hypothetical protein